MFSEQASTAWTIAGTLATVLVAVIGGIMYLRNEFATRSERRWDRALKLAAIVADENASEIVKDVARLGLEEVGVELRERRDAVRAPALQAVMDTFSSPVSQQELEAVEKALSPANDHVTSSALRTDPDILLVARTLQRLWRRLQRIAFESHNSENEIRMRIILTMVLFAAGYFVLALGATKAAL